VSPLEWVFGIIFSLGGASGLGSIALWWRQERKLKAETRHLDVATGIAVDESDDAHWQRIVAAQTEALVEPLRAEIEVLRAEQQRMRDEMATLRTEVETHRTRYWRAITYIRALLAWSRHPSTSDAPAPPAELAVDI